MLNIDPNAEVFESALTLLGKKSQIPSSNINICPMEIKAFIIGR